MQIKAHAQNILDALNTGDRFGERRAKEWITPAIARQGRLRSAKAPVTLPLRLAPPGEYERATEELKNRLRSLVDEWIATGRSPDGREMPHHRSLDGCSLDAEPSPVAVFNRLMAESLQAGERGGLWFLPKGPKMEPGFIAFKSIPSGGLDNPEAAAREYADRLFCALMLVDWNVSICKCARCGKYFEIACPRSIYKRGTHCRSCSSHGSAQRRTREKRQETRNQLLNVSVAAIISWKNKGSRGSMKEWVVRAVKKETRSVITAKWVTRNLPNIEGLAKKHQ